MSRKKIKHKTHVPRPHGAHAQSQQNISQQLRVLRKLEKEAAALKLFMDHMKSSSSSSESSPESGTSESVSQSGQMSSSEEISLPQTAQ